MQLPAGQELGMWMHDSRMQHFQETFGRLRSHLELGAMDVDPSTMGLGPEFAMGRRAGQVGVLKPMPKQAHT